MTWDKYHRRRTFLQRGSACGPSNCDISWNAYCKSCKSKCQHLWKKIKKIRIIIDINNNRKKKHITIWPKTALKRKKYHQQLLVSWMAITLTLAQGLERHYLFLTYLLHMDAQNHQIQCMGLLVELPNYELKNLTNYFVAFFLACRHNWCDNTSWWWSIHELFISNHISTNNKTENTVYNSFYNRIEE